MTLLQQSKKDTRVVGSSMKAIQTKLKIGAANDMYEREADAMADHIMRMPNSYSSQPLTQGAHQIQRKCSACEKEEDQIRRKPLMMKFEGRVPQATPALGSQLNSAKGSGSPLPSGTNQFMSNAFGVDFGDVRVHTDGRARQMNRGLNARAFTHGSDIYFNQGEYNPNSSGGRRLLGHELTHVVQQTGIRNTSSPFGGTSDSNTKISSNYTKSGVQKKDGAIREENSHGRILTINGPIIQRQIEETETVAEGQNQLSTGHNVRDFQRIYEGVYESYTNLSVSIYDLNDTLHDHGIGILNLTANPSQLILNFERAFTRFEQTDSNLDRVVSFTRLRAALHRAQLVLQAANNLIIFQQRHRRRDFGFNVQTGFSFQRSRTLTAFNTAIRMIVDQEANLDASRIRAEANRSDERMRRSRVERRQRRERRAQAEREVELNTLLAQATSNDQLIPNIVVHGNFVRARGIELTNQEARAVSVIDPIALREVSESGNIEGDEITRERRLRELVSDSLGRQSPLFVRNVSNGGLSDEGREAQRRYRGLIIQVARRLIAQQVGQFVREMIPLIGQGAGTGVAGDVNTSREVLDQETVLNEKLAAIRASANELDFLDNPSRTVANRAFRIVEASRGLPYDADGESYLNQYRRREVSRNTIQLAMRLHQSRNRQAEVLESQIRIWRNTFPFLRQLSERGRHTGNSDEQIRRLTLTGFRRVMARFREATQLIQTEEISPFELSQAVRVARNSLPRNARRIALLLEAQHERSEQIRDLGWNLIEFSLVFLPVVGGALSSIVGLGRSVHEHNQQGIRDTIARASLVEGAPFLGVTESTQFQRAIGVLNIALNTAGLGLDLIPSSVSRSVLGRIADPNTTNLLEAEQLTGRAIDQRVVGGEVGVVEPATGPAHDSIPIQAGTQNADEVLESDSVTEEVISGLERSTGSTVTGTRITRSVSHEQLLLEQQTMQRLSARPGAIQAVEEPDLIRLGYEAEINIGEGVVYRRRRDGIWCRFNSPPNCDMEVPDDMERRANEFIDTQYEQSGELLIETGEGVGVRSGTLEQIESPLEPMPSLESVRPGTGSTLAPLRRRLFPRDSPIQDQIEFLARHIDTLTSGRQRRFARLLEAVREFQRRNGGRFPSESSLRRMLPPRRVGDRELRDLRGMLRRYGAQVSRSLRADIVAELNQLLPFEVVAVQRLPEGAPYLQERIASELRASGGGQRRLSMTALSPRTRQRIQIDDFDIDNVIPIEVKSATEITRMLDAVHVRRLLDQLQRHAEFARHVSSTQRYIWRIPRGYHRDLMRVIEQSSLTARERDLIFRHIQFQFME